jgi:hypothetical protein
MATIVPFHSDKWPSMTCPFVHVLLPLVCHSHVGTPVHCCSHARACATAMQVAANALLLAYNAGMDAYLGPSGIGVAAVLDTCFGGTSDAHDRRGMELAVAQLFTLAFFVGRVGCAQACPVWR